MNERRLRILVADGDPEVRSLVERLALGFGHAVESAEDGKACLHKMQQQAYDLLFMELILPIVDGTQILAYMHANTPATRVIVLSAMDDPADIGLILKQGASAFLIKPLRESAILEVISRVSAGTISQDLTPDAGRRGVES
jgi:two-component system OmpR family response regulator